ncbi:MAG: hypothetical protein ACREJC_23235, partial [Tepidisphaeraceae bacterium]
PTIDGACGRCESCRTFDADLHPDFRRIYRQLIRLDKATSKARDVAINLIRDYVVDPAGLKPALGRGRAFVIEEAERMNADAQNSMLKTLEEPPGRALIILLTDQADSLFATVRSRCQIVRFAPIAPPLVEQELVRRGIAADRARLASEFAEGSIGLAVRWLEDSVIENAMRLVAMLDDLATGQSESSFDQFLRASADAYSKVQQKRDENVSLDQAKREGMVVYLRIAAAHLSRGLVQGSPRVAQLAAKCDAIDAIFRAESYLESNVNVSLVAMQVGLRVRHVLQPA